MTRGDVILLACYAALFAVAIFGDAWLDRRERRRAAARAYEHGRRMASQSQFLTRLNQLRAAEPIHGPNLRPDVLRIPGDTDEEIVGWLVDGKFQRRHEW